MTPFVLEQASLAYFSRRIGKSYNRVLCASFSRIVGFSSLQGSSRRTLHAMILRGGRRSFPDRQPFSTDRVLSVLLLHFLLVSSLVSLSVFNRPFLRSCLLRNEIRRREERRTGERNFVDIIGAKRRDGIPRQVDNPYAHSSGVDRQGETEQARQSVASTKRTTLKRRKKKKRR